jgi:hypothetical protein
MVAQTAIREDKTTRARVQCPIDRMRRRAARMGQDLERRRGAGRPAQSPEPAPQLVDSLSEQHIESLAGVTRKAAYDRIALLCALRHDGDYSEEEIAEKAEFGSTEAMHHQLQLWGLAGLLPLEDEEQARKGGAPHKGGERKGRGGGKGGREDAERLPDAVGARDMFEYALARLKSDLHYIQHLEEVLKGPIFEARHVYSKETDPHPLVYRRTRSRTNSPPSAGKRCAPSRARTQHVPTRCTYRGMVAATWRERRRGPRCPWCASSRRTASARRTR